MQCRSPRATDHLCAMPPDRVQQAAQSASRIPEGTRDPSTPRRLPDTPKLRDVHRTGLCTLQKMPRPRNRGKDGGMFQNKEMTEK